MDSFETNKILGGVLAVLTFVVALGIVSEVIFEQEAPEKPGFSVEVAETPAPGAKAAAVVEDPPVATLLASADVTNGQNVFKQCALCHTVEKGGTNGTGPNLYGVMGAPKAHRTDFTYSKAMREAADKGPWDYDAVYHFIKKPAAYIPGTAMGFVGLKKPKDRADLIAYLRSKSDTPAPLPKRRRQLLPMSLKRKHQSAPCSPNSKRNNAPALIGSGWRETLRVVRLQPIRPIQGSMP